VKPIETRYARSGDTRIAYQVIGQGSLDLVFVPGFISNLDLHWEDEGYSRLLKRLSAFSRLILFDKRGTGLSDRVDAHHLPSLETRMDDVRAVMDAAGSGRAAILGSSEGASMAMLFAVAYPERTRALVLHGGYAHFHKWVMPPERLEAFIGAAEAAWGKGVTLPHFAPSRVEDARFAAWWARLERLSASPTAAAALERMNSTIDVRGVLGSAPTLLLHRRNDLRVDPKASRFLAKEIRNSRLVEIPGRDHSIWSGDVDRVGDLVEEFLTGERAAGHMERVLAALLVTRIYDTARLGDSVWEERSRRFLESWRLLVARHGGRAANPHGGMLMSRFDGSGRAIGCAVALRESAQEIGIGSAQAAHVGEIEQRGLPMGLMALVTQQLAVHADPGDILASRLVADVAAGSNFHFTDAGSLAMDKLDEPLAVVRLMSEQHLEPAGPRNRTAETLALTSRESEVVSLIADGKSNAGIAAQLKLSEHTVKRHVANILLKLDLPSRAAAAAFSARHNGPDGP
jgi:pimeloyl-ACP methyl ester carboxylesterase/DNA-binding CsgD family transcriptional regulator